MGEAAARKRKVESVGNVVALDASRGPASVRVARARAAKRVRGHRIGWLVGHDARGPLVEHADAAGTLVARSIVTIEQPADGGGTAPRREVLLVFDEERADRPVIVGLLAAPPPARVERRADEATVRPVVAKVDGRRVVLEADDEIVLQCGEASIVLRRNGRVVIRGAYVETRARGVNRVKGGSVQIN